MPFTKKSTTIVMAIYLKSSSGGVLLSLSMKSAKKPGIFEGIMIFLLVSTLSAKGTIIVRVAPSKMAESPINKLATRKVPKYGLANLSNLK